MANRFEQNGAQVVARALQDLGINLVFGIPGTHTTELFDALAQTNIQSILVGDERSAAFMADGAARVSGRPTALVLVPGAGLTHALSGIAEAWMDSVPMLVVVAGIRTDTGHAFQLHAIDQLAVVRPVVKAVIPVEQSLDLASDLARAYHIAVTGEPGPVVVEVPANLLLLGAPAGAVPAPMGVSVPWDARAFEEALQLIQSAGQVGLYIGQGCREAASEVARLAERLDAPVSWTLSGSGIYPADGPNAVWCGFGQSAPPFAREIFREVDVLVAIGCKFGEVATGSYGLEMPPRLIHVDINAEVFHRNYPATVAVHADAKAFVTQLLERLPNRQRSQQPGRYRAARESYLAGRLPASRGERVSPEHFFAALRECLPRDAVLAVDSGNHTFLAMEGFPVYEPGTFVGPFDYSCMGYGLPAAIGAKLACPERMVAAVVGDGGMLMTGLELLTAVRLGLGMPVFVFQDGALGQIAQFQKVPLNRTTCTTLAELHLKALAEAVGADYVELGSDRGLFENLTRIVDYARAGRTVLVGVRVDYRRKTAFTQGVLKTNLDRLPAQDRWRMLTRALVRHTIDREAKPKPLAVKETAADLGRVLLVGQGAIGAALGARLSASGASFQALERNQELARLLTENGVLLDGYGGQVQSRYPVWDQLPDGDVFDTVFLMTKAYDAPQALAEILPRLAENGTVVSLQNGIHTEALTRMLPERQLVGGVIEFAAVHLGEGHVTIKSPHGRLLVGRVDGSRDARLEAVQAFLNRAMPTQITSNLIGHLWSKLLVNSFLNPLGALFDAPFGELLQDPQILPICFRLITETVAVANAAGVHLEKLQDKLPPAWLTDSSWLRAVRPWVFKAMAREIAEVRSSMWQDLAAGRPTEIDFLNGHIIGTGRRLGIHCPTHEAIVRLIKEREASGRQRSRDDLLLALNGR